VLETLPPLPGMNRAQRRQMARANGHRGSKAKRQHGPQPRFLGPPPPEAIAEMKRKIEEGQAEVADHERRNGARRMGLLIPPSSAEARTLRETRGAPVGAGALIVPKGA
jgi:hypothetical protein